MGYISRYLFSKYGCIVNDLFGTQSCFIAVMIKKAPKFKENKIFLNVFKYINNWFYLLNNKFNVVLKVMFFITLNFYESYI